jgi:YesN/AraC family two-component response regulator
MSFNEYLTNARISKAKNIIEDSPDMPIKDVALVVGYSDPFYFSRVFRSVTGVPPSEYFINTSSADG